ncbi:hypothetical protein, partial [Clostridium perfringens]
EYFRSVHGDARILPVIVDGEPFASVTHGDIERECFPPAMLARVEKGAMAVKGHVEPIAADLRHAGDGRHLALLKLVA